MMAVCKGSFSIICLQRAGLDRNSSVRDITSVECVTMKVSIAVDLGALSLYYIGDLRRSPKLYALIAARE